MIRAGIRRFFHLALRRKDRWEADVEDEIKLHLALRAEQLMTDGRDPHNAYDEAVRRFGPLTESRARLLDAARHRERTMQRTEYFADLRQDIGFAVRTLGRQKMWTAVTVFTFALGIGATTAVFSVVSTLLIHAVPYPDADRVVIVNQQPSTGNNTGISVTISPAMNAIRAWRAGARSFEALEPARIGPRTLKTESEEPSRVNTAAVLPTFPTFAGVRPIRGRMFTDADIAAGNRVALLGEGFWRDRLGGDPGAMGKVITVGDSTYTILGVLPAALRFGPSSGHPTDIWIPFDLADRNGGGSLLGRLRPGINNAAAQRELDSISAHSGGFSGSSIPFVAVVQSPVQRVKFRDSLELLAAAVGLLLIVACVNVAHLLLARSAARQREMAIRTALGAGIPRLFRQLLTESVMLTAAGAALGLGIGWSSLRVLVALRPASHDELIAARLDATTVCIAVVVAVACGIGFGVASAIQATRHSAHDALKSGSHGAGGARAHRRTRAVLVVSEIALSAMLVVGTGLVLRSLERLQHTDLGFDAKNLYTIYLTYGSKLADSTGRVAALRAVESRLRALPGVTATTVADVGPGSRWFSVGRFEIDGEPPPPADATSFNDVNHVQPNYFQTMGIRFVEGSTFSDTSAHAVIVNEGFARKHWPRRTAVGNRIRIVQKGGEPWLTIAGVVHDALTSGPSAESTAPSLYLPPVPGNDRNLLVRATGGARSLVGVRKIAREAGVREVTIDGVEDFVSRSISEPRFVTAVLTSFSVVALLLASIGLYGLMAYTVAQEAPETGIRLALGASRGRIMRSVLARGAALAVTGTMIGLGAAAWGTRMIENRLYGVARLDPISFAAGAVVLIAAALVACIIPTRRALTVDLVTAIRAE